MERVWLNRRFERLTLQPLTPATGVFMQSSEESVWLLHPQNGVTVQGEFHENSTNIESDDLFVFSESSHPELYSMIRRAKGDVAAGRARRLT